MNSVDYVYSVATGGLYQEAPDVRRIASGYSGSKGHVNNVASQRIVAKGPIPAGVVWRLCPAYNHPRLGPVAIRLEHVAGEIFGRSGFFIHGDNGRGDNSASSGCIILPRDVRERIAAGIASGADRLLTV